MKYSEYMKKKEKEKNSQKDTTSQSSVLNSLPYNQYKAAKRFGLDTLESDLTTLSKTIGKVYDGWQTKETMENTLSSVQSMYDRLGKFQEYSKEFGGPDITDLRNAYKGVLDNWDSLSSNYALFKNADSYKAEKDTLKKLSNMKSSEVKKYIDDAPNIDGWLNTAKNYESKLNSNALDKFNLTSIGRLDEKMRETPNEAFNVLLNGIKTDNSDSTKKEYDEFLKGIGYSGIKDLESAKSGIAYTTASGENITWKSLYDTKKYTEEHNNLYNNISSKADFDKYTKKGASVKDPTYGEVYSISSIFNPKEVTNVVEFTFNNQDAMLADRDSNASPAAKYAYYTKISPQERSIYNYYVGRELEGKEEKGTAQKYLDSIYGKLKDRYENNMLERDIQFGEEKPRRASLYSVGQSLGSGVEWLADTINYAKTGELDDNFLARSSSTIRSSVSDKYDWNIDFLDGWDAFDFVYNTGMSMADSAAAMVTMGGAGGVALGLSAAAQGTNDALERGLDNKSAFWSGLTSGVFEGLFESVSIGKFKSLKDAPVDGVKSLKDAPVDGVKSLKDAPVDGVKSLIKNVGKSMLTNASEETLTELANLTYDYFANGDLSQYATQVRAYMSAGLSEKEAIRKVALEQAAQVTEAGASGALMGFGFGVTGGTYALRKNSSVGSNIRTNDRVSELLDLVSNPEIGTAYEAYTQYANKGINADNIKNAQLGSLYRTAKGDAIATMHDKKASGEQKVGAFQTLAKIADIDTPNTIKTEAKKNYNIGEETKVTDTGETFDIKDVKVKGEDVVVATKDGEISVDDATFTQRDAELVQYARGLAKTDGDAVAELFLNQYDGKMSPEKYATSFNLTVEYAKKDYTFEHMINNRGELTAQQVSDIYKETRIAADRARAEKIKKLNKAMADKMAYKGFVDDTVIDYNNTSAEGKVNWNSLTLQQRQAVTFVTGFAQAVGMRVKFIKDGEAEGINGSYSISSNEIIIDIYAGTSEAASLIKDTIIPTMSHETTHWMRRKSPEMWRNLNEIVFKTLVDHYNSNTEQAINDKINLLLKRDGVEYTAEEAKEMTITEEDIVKAEYRKISLKRKTTEDEAREEIIARACEDMLKKSQQGRKIFSSLSVSEQKSLVEKFKAVISDLLQWVNDLLNSYDSKSTEARIMREYKEQLEKASKVWDEMLKQSVVANQSLEKSGAFKVNKVNEAQVETEPFFATSEMLNAVDEDGKSLFQYRAMEEDKDIYREMLNKNKHIIGITNKQIKDLFDMIDNAVEIISNNLKELDYSWEADINDRAFSPIKPNSDSLYKVSLDFSTLCRKRLLQQTIQQTLQEALNKNLSKEESIAIRDELMKIQEEGRKIEVACALCYVESARMKSPVQINKFLKNREAVIKEFFANRSGGSIAEKVAETELKARKKLKKDNPNGFFGKNDVMLDPLTAPKSHMKKADADYIRAEGKKAKLAYKLTEHEQAELDAAMSMGVGEFTSAKGLENLAKNHPDIFDAYTSFVRNATHSKGIENDTWWRAGDSEAIGDNLIAQMNAENGLRSQSWSDFQVIHLLDYIAATIELSTKGAKRQSYTKVPDYVKLLGNTGDMINISLIPERVFNGKLSYDPVEGMAYDIAKQLRDEYHATVGSICIGINNEQIKMLLADGTIDMVIPYHHSSMSKAVRKLMHIPAWETYQNYQSEKKLSDTEAKAQAKKYDVKLNTDSNYQKAPKFSEWFDLAEARQIAEYENLKAKNGNPTDAEAYKKYGKMYGGYVAMQKAADRYLKLCAERGLSPKFSDEKSDFTKEANYWKLLIDRKMVDNVTGEIIEQKAIKPIFKESDVLEILNDELKRYPQIKADQDYATRKVTEKFLSGEMKMDKSTREAIKKPIDNVTKVNILESAEEGKLKRSDRDSKGNTLTKEQQEYFKDSKVRDENGNLLVMYHGTKADFTVFEKGKLADKLGFFFTESKEEASDYGKAKPYYLNITNPIDIWGDEYFKYSSIRDSEKQREALVKDGYDGIYSFSHGTKWYISFKSNQNKNVDNTNPTSKPDIRYSDRTDTDVYDLMGERDALLERNKRLEADVERLRKRIRLDKKVTGGTVFREDQIGAVARYLRKEFNSNMDVKELSEKLMDNYKYIAQILGDNPYAAPWEDVFAGCYNIAYDLESEAKPRKMVDEYSAGILNDIRKTRISLSESQKAEAQHIFGKNWNRHFFNRVAITDKGIPIESMWKDWAEQYPNTFSAETNPIDMLSELYEIIGSLQDTKEITEEYDKSERLMEIAEEIYNKFWTITPVRTTADKYVSEIKKLNFEHRKAMEQAKVEYEQRRVTDKNKHIRLAKGIRERRDRDVARAKELGRQRLESFKENAEKKTQIQKITADVMSLKELLVKNSKDKHVPEVLKGPVRTLIQAIDFSSKRLLEKGIPTQKDISLQNALRQVTDMMASTNSALEGVVDMYGIGLDSKMADMMKSVDRIVASIGTEKFTLQMMSAEELKTLATMTKVIKASVNSLNKFHVAHHNAGVQALGFETAQEVDAAKKMHKNNKKHFDKLKTKTYWNNLTPYYAFKNLGKAAQKIFTAFQDGQDKVAFLAKEIIDFTEGLYTTKEYKKWNETFFDFEIKQPDGKIKKVSMNVPQIMSLYCVAKQEDALNHILHGVEDDKGNKGKGRGITLAETDTTEAVLTNILLTEADLKEITSKLDEVDRAKEVADELQKFMSTRGAELGNEVSMARWGIKSFGIENYFPIKVSDGSAPKKNETPGVQGNPLLALLNMSFTHARTLNAPQSIEIGNVFDVFANHMSSMIQYNAMALPVLDMYKWLNAQGVDENGNEISLMTSIRSTFGDEAWSYFNTFLKDVNGATKSQRRDNWAVKFFKNSKIAKVAANIRVVALQFTSYIRAGSVMDNKYLLRALVHKPKIQRSEEKCGMVLWKSLGYFNTDISSPLANKIKHVESIKDKITDFSLKGAEWADKITLGYLWNACELEVRDTRKDLQVGSDEFNKEIALRLRDVIYRTQVVDSQLTRSQMMRSPETWDKMLTTFASESTLSFNLITDIYVSYKLDSRRMGKEKAKEKHGKYMRKAIIAYAVTNVATSMIASLFDAFRDYDEDDKDEEYWLKLMLGNLATDFSFINKIPYLNLFISAIQGFGASRTDAEWMEESVRAVKNMYKFMTGEGSGEKAFSSTLKALSDVTGVAGYNLYRDIRAFIEMFDD